MPKRIWKYDTSTVDMQGNRLARTSQLAILRDREEYLKTGIGGGIKSTGLRRHKVVRMFEIQQSGWVKRVNYRGWMRGWSKKFGWRKKW